MAHETHARAAGTLIERAKVRQRERPETRRQTLVTARHAREGFLERRELVIFSRRAPHTKVHEAIRVGPTPT